MDVSVIVPIYKVEPYIERCARSLFGQTKMDGIEFVFVDDCSPDSSMDRLLEILEEYPHRKDQVKIVRHPQNKGLPAARKSGVLASSGKYLAHCDSDDWVEPDMYESLFDAAEHQGADLVFCDMNTDDGEKLVRFHTKNGLRFTKEELIGELLLGSINPGICRILGRRSIYDGLVFPSHNVGEDYATVLQLIMNSSSFAFVDKALYNYCYNPSSMTKAAGLESKWNYYLGISKNIRMMEEIILGRYGHEYDDGLFFMKVKAMTQVAPYIEGKSLRREWRSVFPEVNLRKVMTNSCLGWRKRSIWILSLIAVYPSMKRMKQRLLAAIGKAERLR